MPFPFRPVHAWLFGVGRPACGLSTVKWRLQLHCGWCAFVLAASWSAWFACVPSRCCQWSYRRMLFVQPARRCRRWLVASWLVQVQCTAVCQRWLAAFVMVELRCSVAFVGMVVSGRGAPRCCHPVGRRSRFDPCTPGWFGVGWLACGLFTVMWRRQLRCGWCAVSWPPHGRLGSCGFRRAAAGGLIVKSCLCSRHIHVGAGSCVLVCPSVV